MNPELSKKIKFMSFISIIGVVFCHAYNYTDSFLQPTTRITEGANAFAMFQFFTSNAIVRYAVALFFAISGYLFFRNFEPKLSCYLNKLKKRFFSLVIPYAIWTILSGLFIFTLYKIFGMMKFQIVYEKMGSLFYDGLLAWVRSAPAFQLWFIYDLVKLIIISPILYILIKKLKLVPICILALAWLIDYSIIFNNEGILFFSIGAYIAIHGKEALILKHSQKASVIIPIIWIITCLLYTFISAGVILHNCSDLVLLFLYKFNVIAGIVSVSLLYGVNGEKLLNNKWVALGASNTFIIYVLHEPLQHVLYDLFLHMNSSDLSHTIIYILLGPAIIVLCIAISAFFRKYLPKVHKVLTGGR